MGSGMGAPDEEMNRRQVLQKRRIDQMADGTAVGGSSPDGDGSVSTSDASADEMLAQYKQDNGDTTMTKEKKKLKSPRYSDVPAYTLEVLDTDTLKDEVFPGLDFTSAEKEAAGALINNPDLNNREVAEKCTTSQKTVGRVRRILETKKNPTSNQRAVLKYARENPDATMAEIADATDSSRATTKVTLRQYRHERIVCEVEVEEDDADDEESTDETTVDDEQDVSDGDDTDDDSDESDAVERDLAGDDDVTYKYDTDGQKPETRGGNELTQDAVTGLTDLLDIFREHERRLQEVEARDPKQVPQSFNGRVASLETRVEGVQSVADRIEDQQLEVERHVEDLKEQCEGVADAADLDLKDTSLGQKVERIEDSLSSHKEAIQELRESDTGGSTSFSTEEKRRLVVSLAENGEDDLIDRVLEEL
ncbi:HTH domain-containing protein [Haloarcula virus HCTV-16]|nr:HTH domain-containing protein [Haloarcula virus HCTV-16]